MVIVFRYLTANFDYRVATVQQLLAKDNNL